VSSMMRLWSRRYVGIAREVVQSWGITQKHLEEQYMQEVRHDQPVLLRLDGHRFSRFTQGFHKPYDWRIVAAMHATSGDLLEKFNPEAVYTQSDEITLVFAQGPDKQIVFRGKTQKLASVVAALCSVRFAYHLRRGLLQQPDTGGSREHLEMLLDKVEWVHFDARVFNVPDMESAAVNILWRQEVRVHALLCRYIVFKRSIDRIANGILATVWGRCIFQTNNCINKALRVFDCSLVKDRECIGKTRYTT
jgi:hypothetical protein